MSGDLPSASLVTRLRSPLYIPPSREDFLTGAYTSPTQTEELEHRRQTAVAQNQALNRADKLISEGSPVPPALMQAATRIS